MRRTLSCVSMALFCGLAARAQTPGGTDAVNVSWTRFADPNENAFTIDVPTGWQTQGGLVRRGPIDYSYFLRVLSPDKQVMLILGDPGPAYFFAPWYGAPRTARPYVPGPTYAREYVESSLQQDCQGLTFVSGGDRQDVANGPLAQGTPYAQHTAGDALYRCTHNGKPTQVYMIAGTFLYQQIHQWGLNLLAGCLAPADRMEASKSLVLHMIKSAKSDPQWVKTEQGFIDAAARNINMITAAQQKAFVGNLASAKRTQAAMQQQYDSFDSILTGTATMTDPSGKTYYNVPNTQGYQWVRGGQTTQTTSSAPPPGGGWQPLKQAPAN